ncbi:hypothetical protein AB0O07_16600 [Streptomyces sp. NPDC093085]|uniref:hypothetical protein n=1 Tax=Streptomyces sp. NPDC093085 TaxID=3155068 RepID=UPI003429B18D
MEAELMALATAGATAFVQQMATDSWAQARARIARFFARRADAEDGVVEGELETSREELTAALASDDEQTAADVEAAWRLRLRRTLAANPSAAAELRTILNDLTPPTPEERPMNVHNTISGGVQHGMVIQAGNTGPITGGTPPPAHD